MSNFALIDQMALLETLVNGNGAWCATVASECSTGATKPGLEKMAIARSIFGEPIYATPAEHVDIIVLQDQMRQPGDRDTAHLGESETIAIIISRQLRAAFVTDDRDAQRQAALRGIPVYSTWHILKLGVATGHLTSEDFLAAYQTLVDADRGHPPCGRGESSVAAWIIS
ncbi:hypothetical protein [Microbacterium natoriense]|uniref:hypothetical protein n=1 Tax=Microbacterium natoriense TaxID=284570 RepID=UPI0027D91680|nr:hypothetical protein [Microbacterium natoriense]